MKKISKFPNDIWAMYSNVQGDEDECWFDDRADKLWNMRYGLSEIMK